MEGGPSGWGEGRRRRRVGLFGGEEGVHVLHAESIALAGVLHREAGFSGAKSQMGAAQGDAVYSPAGDADVGKVGLAGAALHCCEGEVEDGVRAVGRLLTQQFHETPSGALLWRRDFASVNRQISTLFEASLSLSTSL